MASVTIKIGKFDAARQGYPVELLEDGQPPIQNELLPAAGFVSGDWRVEIGNGVAAAPAGAAAPKDIVATVMDTPGRDRAGLDWVGLGNKLFDLLFPPGTLRDRFKTWDAETRLALDIQPAELQRVPWELAQSAGPPPRRIAKIFALTRLHAASAAPAARRNSEWPLRILILVGCSTADAIKLEVNEEIDLIRRAYVSVGRSVDIHVQSPALYKELTALIEGKPPIDNWKPHVLHFVGHTGVADDGSVGLQIDRSDIDQANWVLSTDDVQTLLGDLDWAPQLVFLNACRTGADHVGTWTFQQSFIDAGAQCVVTMQADIRGSLAGMFAGEFYAQVAAGQTVQEAARRARNTVHDSQQPTKLMDWALPAMSTSGPNIKLFKVREPPDDDQFRTCEEFRQARVFANCETARRLLTHWICPARTAAPAEPSNVVLLTGDAQCGKSHILKWAMESWVLANARVRYLELHDTRPKDFLAILRQVRDGDGAGGKRFLQRRLPPLNFKRFNWTLNNLLKTGQPGAWVDANHPGAEIADLGDPIAALGEERPEPMVCAEFHGALKAVAEQTPLILVFDKFTSDGTRLVRPEDFSALVTHLFTPIARDPASRIKIVFSANLVECQAYSLDQIPKMVTYPVPDNFSMDDLVRYAVEMIRFKDEPIVRGIAQFALQLQSPAKGVARLAAITRALGDDYVNKIERMQ